MNLSLESIYLTLYNFTFLLVLIEACHKIVTLHLNTYDTAHYAQSLLIKADVYVLGRDWSAFPSVERSVAGCKIQFFSLPL